jgi:mRNA interferase HigB
MRVISKRPLRDFWTLHPDAKSNLEAWWKVATKTNWDTFAEVRQTYGTASLVGRCIVFNICGNKYRLIVTARFEYGCFYVRGVKTHAEYDRNGWKEECLCQD